MKMPVVAVRPMSVDVLRFLMFVLMSVGGCLVHRRVGMVMVAVAVGMDVDVDRLFMAVPMAVLLPDHEPGAGGHENEGRQHQNVRCFFKHDGGEAGRDEGRQAEKRSCPGRAPALQGFDEEDEAQPIAYETEEEARSQVDIQAGLDSQNKGDYEGDRTGAEPFDSGDKDRVLVRDVPGQVVVEGPAEHGRQDQDRAGQAERPSFRVPGQDDSGRRHESQSRPQARGSRFLK